VRQAPTIPTPISSFTLLYASEKYKKEKKQKTGTTIAGYQPISWIQFMTKQC